MLSELGFTLATCEAVRLYDMSIGLNAADTAKQYVILRIGGLSMQKGEYSEVFLHEDYTTRDMNLIPKMVYCREKAEARQCETG